MRGKQLSKGNKLGYLSLHLVWPGHFCGPVEMEVHKFGTLKKIKNSKATKTCLILNPV